MHMVSKKDLNSAEQGMESCQKHLQAQRKRQGYILLARGRMRPPGCGNKRVGGKRVCGRFRTCMHMVSKKDLNSAELETVRTSGSPTTVVTDNGEVRTNKEATVHVKELDLFVTVVLLEETPAVLSLGKLCQDNGYTYHLTTGQKPHITNNGKRIDCNFSNDVPFVIPGFSPSSSKTPTPTSSASSSQDSVFDVNRYTENPVSERSGSTSEELRGNLQHKPTETENKNLKLRTRRSTKRSIA